MQKIVSGLWFDMNAEEAMQFYVDAFSKTSFGASNSYIEAIKRYPDEVSEDFMKGMEGKVLNGIFQLAGYKFFCLDGGSRFKFTPAISFFVRSNSVDDIDTLWNALSDNSTVLMPLDTYPFSQKYGWIQDKFGLSWQLVVEDSIIEQTIVPSLMFISDGKQAEAAIRFYADIFPNSEVGNIMRYPADQAPQVADAVSYAELTLANQHFVAMDSAPIHDFTFNEAISFYVECDSQAEVDAYWNSLSAIAEAEQCGWLKDEYGISWQIIPKQLGELMSDPDPVKVERVMQAMLQMKKIIIADLETAYTQPIS